MLIARSFSSRLVVDFGSPRGSAFGHRDRGLRGLVTRAFLQGHHLAAFYGYIRAVLKQIMTFPGESWRPSS